MTITATDSVSVSGGSLLSNLASGRGDAGRVIVSAPTLSIDNGRIQATTWGEGHAGSLDVQVGRLMLTGGAQIDSSTRGAGHGGEVTVAAREAITISGQSRLDVSGLYSNAFSSGEAGRLAVATPLLTMDNSLIQAVAAADSRGNAGGLDVQVGRLMLTGGAQIDSGTRAGSTGRGGS